MKTGLDFIAEERPRQIEIEGFDSEHDATHVGGELALAAASYAVVEDMREVYKENVSFPPDTWPFPEAWWKPSPENRIKELSKVGALAAAEIDRIIALKKCYDGKQ